MNSGDTLVEPMEELTNYVAQRRPEYELRRHQLACGVAGHARKALNEGRSMNSGDTSMRESS